MFFLHIYTPYLTPHSTPFPTHYVCYSDARVSLSLSTPRPRRCRFASPPRFLPLEVSSAFLFLGRGRLLFSLFIFVCIVFLLSSLSFAFSWSLRFVCLNYNLLLENGFCYLILLVFCFRLSLVCVSLRSSRHAYVELVVCHHFCLVFFIGSYPIFSVALDRLPARFVCFSGTSIPTCSHEYSLLVYSPGFKPRSVTHAFHLFPLSLTNFSLSPSLHYSVYRLCGTTVRLFCLSTFLALPPASHYVVHSILVET